MRTIEMKQNTFGKATQNEIMELLPNANTFKKIETSYSGKNYLIKDKNNKTIAVWMNRFLKTGILKIY